MLKLRDNETVLACWAENATGPGWSNTPVCVLLHFANTYRVEWIQPADQTPEMQALFNVSAAVNRDMVRAAESIARAEARRV